MTLFVGIMSIEVVKLRHFNLSIDSEMGTKMKLQWYEKTTTGNIRVDGPSSTAVPGERCEFAQRYG